MILDWVTNAIASAKSKPCIIGMSGANGIGKTTICESLLVALGKNNLKGASISIDDFYLTRNEQIQLSSKFANNRFLQHRGYPGTHDIDLGLEIIQKLKNKNPSKVRVPTYDKSAFDGCGDRFPEAKWKTVETPLDFILWEGWMLGFQPITESEIKDVHLKQINQLLFAYERWNALLDSLIILKPEKMEYVIDWRTQAEQQRRNSGRGAMTEIQTIEFSRSFLFALELYSEKMCENPPCLESIQFIVNKDRLLKSK